MNYTAYRMQFHTGVHFGKRRVEDGEHLLYADTIFSALCQEAVQVGEGTLERLVSCAQSGAVRLSDAFPYHQDTYYIPKPVMSGYNPEERSSVRKKALKKLEYLPIESLDDFLGDHLDVIEESQKLKNMGAGDIQIQATMEGGKTTPYSVGVYRFRDGWGLYFLLAWKKEEDRILIESLLKGLQFAGIGGRRSNGMGRFSLIGDTEETVGSQLSAAFLQGLRAGESDMEISTESIEFLSLTSCLPSEEELEEILRGARYSVVRRSGFICSETYGKVPLKKEESYLLKSGSVFEHPFGGTILDVSSGVIPGIADHPHPVYRYAKPMFLGVRKSER